MVLRENTAHYRLLGRKTLGFKRTNDYKRETFQRASLPLQPSRKVSYCIFFLSMSKAYNFLVTYSLYCVVCFCYWISFSGSCTSSLYTQINFYLPLWRTFLIYKLKLKVPFYWTPPHRHASQRKHSLNHLKACKSLPWLNSHLLCYFKDDGDWCMMYQGCSQSITTTQTQRERSLHPNGLVFSLGQGKGGETDTKRWSNLPKVMEGSSNIE